MSALRLKRVACLVVGLLASVQLLPAVALACEVECPETQKVSFKPIQNGGKCPENAAKRVVFKVLKETCEYRLENENAKEKILIQKVEIGLEKQCMGFFTNCIGSVTSSIPTCVVSLPLTPGGVCYVNLEYQSKPAAPPSLSSLEVETKSTLGGITNSVRGQTLE